MTESPVKVIAVESIEPSQDGTFVEFSFQVKDTPPLVLTIPTDCLYTMAVSTLAAANAAYAAAGRTADQQIPVAEFAEVYSDPDQVDFHFQLTDTPDAVLPIGLSTRDARVVLEQLRVFLEGSSASPTGNPN